MSRRPVVCLAATLAFATLLLAAAPNALALDRAALERHASVALRDLYANNETARELRSKAVAVLVFPSIVKAGFLFGGQIGDGVLLKNGRVAGFYNTVAASYGFQAGVQTFGYALFFMNDKALAYLDESHGWDVGVGPSIVIVDEGFGKSVTASTLTSDVYAFIFDQKGLMGGVGVQGSKITRIAD
jgi:lipid-binding SYLF domain-containing protein